MRLFIVCLLALAFAVPAQAQTMRQVIHSEFGYGSLGRTMICIARRESHLKSWAANWTDSHGGSFGLFQINGVWRHKGETTMHFARRMWNPMANARTAHWLYRTQGLEPWGGGC